MLKLSNHGSQCEAGEEDAASVYGYTGTHYEHTFRERVARPGMWMRRVCTGTQARYDHTVRERAEQWTLRSHRRGASGRPWLEVLHRFTLGAVDRHPRQGLIHNHFLAYPT